MLVQKLLVALALPLLFCTVTLGSGPDFPACLQQILQSNGSLEGTVDVNGHPTTNISQITGLTYDRCVADCGHGPVNFDWHTFSQQFTSWLLPWLALISQLPYGSRDTLSNCLAVLLTVGSPTLAAYSLALAVISNRWMVKRFGRSGYYPIHHLEFAAQTLSNLQQVSLELPNAAHNVLPSLIVDRRNQPWLEELAHGLEYAVPKWTLSSIMSVVYVALADLFTWIDTLSGPLSNIVVNATGESISSLWLCFLPIVIGNLQLSPKTDSNRIRRAFNNAESHLVTTADEGSPEQARASGPLLINMESQATIDEDELAPVYFYARAFTWIRVVREVADGFDAASQHASGHRTNTQHDSYEIFTIFATSTLLALFLQWGTTGAAIMAMFFTPTKGLGCRSGAYLLYGVNSTLIWFLCVLSSVLAHYYKKGTRISTFIWGTSLVLRYTAKCLAAGNTVWLFLTAILQFGNLDDTCWCNSSKLSLHSKAYTVIIYTDSFLAGIKIAWAGGLAMAFLTAALFLIALNVFPRRLAKEPDPRILLQRMGASRH
ncbi:hypothetical protein F5887DRAFT_180604 [Amanita rubescens]|nr:hypothetical protein F5887DRAFT_180604 [Amanita rubescens]